MVERQKLIADAIVLQHGDALERNRTGLNITDRGALRYMSRLAGIRFTIEYARTLGEPGVLLDIGMGAGNALAHFTDCRWLDGIPLAGTILPREQYRCRPKNVRIYQTGVEWLDEVESDSTLVVISVDGGLMYTGFPNLAADSLARVVVDRGVVKANFALATGNGPCSPKGWEEHKRELARVGFATAHKTLLVDSSLKMVMVCIKGGDKDTAERLLNDDFDTVESQKETFPRFWWAGRKWG
ncbi:MAG: hypothetical protein UW69_C0052G0002 [Microgenomates group bacterium GW2011_GWA2_44_7]|nr:MAG: hypothetical protein UW69_C0052G0002 [Microgenomates group bacterium GW2011_GWA2_44_7]KKT77310.1 MAG: hypothetical protein UW73_C0023G0015 [Microgenomates group bacterium GW2011_GWB1_44_8]